MESNITTLYTWITNLFNSELPAIIAVVTLPLVFVILYALLAILGELKISAFIQERLGPMRTGPWGIFQPIAEVVKLLQKEDITPDAANKPLYNLAPYLMFAASYAGFAVIPFCANYAPSGINLGLFYIFAVGSLGVIGLVMGGWASNNKYSLLGAMRSVAQIISYEIPGAITILSVVVLANSMDMQVITAKQAGWFWNWNLFGGAGGWGKLGIFPFTAILAIVYLISSLAETNRTPFDIPEGESELVAGYHTEYSGMKFAMFFFAEYANMFIVAAVLAVMFFGGWNSPFGNFMSGPIWGVFWFIGKSFFFVFLQIWLRWTLPRLRVDQLMTVSWKYLVPISLVCFFAVGIWILVQ